MKELWFHPHFLQRTTRNHQSTHRFSHGLFSLTEDGENDPLSSRLTNLQLATDQSQKNWPAGMALDSPGLWPHEIVTRVTRGRSFNMFYPLVN